MVNLFILIKFLVMKKELASKFAFLAVVSSHLVPVDFVDEDVVPSPESQLDLILNEIFSVDPVSGLPKGDIAYYLGENGNAQVREWIKNNLLQPRSVLTGSDPSKVSDDLIVEFSRRSDETNEAYAMRLSSIRSEAVENIRKLQESKTE